MPTQQPNLTSESGSVAAALDRSIALADGALAVARPNASIAAPDDALSEKNAAGQTAARSLLSLLKRYWRAFRQRRQRQSPRASLHHLSDRALMDIGLRREEIDYIAPRQAIDTLRDLWILSRGVI